MEKKSCYGCKCEIKDDFTMDEIDKALRVCKKCERFMQPIKLVNDLKDRYESDKKEDVFTATVNFRMLVREGETSEEATDRFIDAVLSECITLADHHVDWEIVECGME